MAVEAARGRGAARDRRAREAVGAQLGGVALELLGGRLGDGLAEEGAQRGQVAPVRLDRPRRAPRGEQREEALDVGIAFHLVRGFAVERFEPWFVWTPHKVIGASRARVRVVVDAAEALRVDVAVHLGRREG